MEAWTDERLDDLAATLRPLPAQVARNSEAIERLGDEMAAMRVDFRAEMAALRADFSAMQRQIAQIGWALSAALVGVLIALIVAVA